MREYSVAPLSNYSLVANISNYNAFDEPNLWWRIMRNSCSLVQDRHETLVHDPLAYPELAVHQQKSQLWQNFHRVKKPKWQWTKSSMLIITVKIYHVRVKNSTSIADTNSSRLWIEIIRKWLKCFQNCFSNSCFVLKNSSIFSVVSIRNWSRKWRDKIITRWNVFSSSVRRGRILPKSDSIDQCKRTALSASGFILSYVLYSNDVDRMRQYFSCSASINWRVM